MKDIKYEELLKDYKDRFGTQTFCDNCGVTLSAEQEAIFVWFIRKLEIK